MNMRCGLLSPLLFWQNCVHFSLFTKCAYHFPSSSTVELKTDLEQNRSWTDGTGVESFYLAGLDGTI